MEKMKIAMIGGTICFYGDWFGRPCDNFHKFKGAVFEDNTLNIRFEHGEALTVIQPVDIINEPNRFEIKQAFKVVWTWHPCGSSTLKELSYQYQKDDQILKRSGNREMKMESKGNSAVQCLSFGMKGGVQ